MVPRGTNAHGNILAQAAYRFPSIKRAAIVQDIKVHPLHQSLSTDPANRVQSIPNIVLGVAGPQIEFRENAHETDLERIKEYQAVAQRSYSQLLSFSGLDASSPEWYGSRALFDSGP